MALPLYNNFEEGTASAILTPANTSGGGQNGFDAVSIGTGSAGVFINTTAAHGTLSAYFSTGTAGNPATASWSTSMGSVTTLYGRSYLYLSANPAYDDNVIAFKGGGTFGGGIMLATTRQLRTQNAAFGETGGPVIPIATWCRLEWKVVAGAAGAAYLTVYYYASPDSTTITSTVADIYGAYGSGGVITETDWGWTSTHPSQPAVAFDSIALSATGYLGPDTGSTAPSGGMSDTAGAVDRLTVSTSVIAMADAAGAVDAAVTSPGPVPVALADAAGATDTIVVSKAATVFTPAPVALAPARPAFIRSQMPRMHVQNLLTGQWLHRDVQGISSPSVTWNLNQPDTFACTLSPPRPDMIDASGNPLFLPWRDAVYLEEDDQIRWGGLITSGTQAGQQWTISCTGFAGYANGMPYDGPAYTEYNVDAGDVIRYLWDYIQDGVNSNIHLAVSPAKIGKLLGSTVSTGASGTLTRTITPADVIMLPVGPASEPGMAVAYTFTALWVSNWAQGFSVGQDISIGGTEDARITAVISYAGHQTGEIHVNGTLSHHHVQGEQVLQVPTNTLLSKAANAGQNSITIGNPLGFSAGQVILLKGNKPYTIQSILSNPAGEPTGVITLTYSLSEHHDAREPVHQAPTPFQLLWWNTPDCGSEIASIQAEAIFDWRERHAWASPAKEDVNHALGFGVPRLGGRRTDLRFAEGENIIQPVQVAQGGTGYADSVIVLGSGSGSAQVRTGASQPSGRLRRVSVYQNQTMTTVARAASVGQRVLAAAEAAIDTPVQVVIVNHPNAPFGHFACGDDIYVQLATHWRNTGFWVRITAIQQNPTTNIMTLTVARSDSFSYISQSGLAGTI